MKLLVFILSLLLAGTVTTRAHDPYEIASVVYIQSNRIEIFMEMEFATGIILAGRQPSRDVSAESQFAAALPQLEQFAGGLFEITAGKNAVLPLRTNVELGVEAHIRGHLEFALTDFRPLRFAPRGLRVVQNAPYGISLTVLDMVNKKVLGQTTLFADSPPAEFPAAVSTTNPLAAPMLAVTKTDELPVAEVSTNLPLGAVQASKPPKPGLLTAVVVIAGVAILLAFWRWSQARS